MNSREAEDLFDSIFPIGEERWVKLKYLDRDKCIKTFRLGQHTENSKKHAENAGYEVTAIGIKPEYTPQVSALMDVRDAVVQQLNNVVENYHVDSIRNIFKMKIDEITERTIMNIPIDGLEDT
jgi:hypothetical protein